MNNFLLHAHSLPFWGSPNYFFFFALPVQCLSFCSFCQRNNYISREDHVFFTISEIGCTPSYSATIIDRASTCHREEKKLYTFFHRFSKKTHKTAIDLPRKNQNCLLSRQKMRTNCFCNTQKVWTLKTPLFKWQAVGLIAKTNKPTGHTRDVIKKMDERPSMNFDININSKAVAEISIYRCTLLGPCGFHWK